MARDLAPRQEASVGYSEVMNRAFDDEPRSEPEDASRAAIDAALRGQRPLTEAIAEKVTAIDAALDAHPLSEAIVVALTSATAVVPVELQHGDEYVEKAYLRSYLVGTGHRFDGVESVVWLQVPAGTPALFLESQDSSPASFLLGRGLRWRVDRAFVYDGQRIITASVVGRVAEPVEPLGHPLVLRDTRADRDYFERTKANLAYGRDTDDQSFQRPVEAWGSPTSIGVRAGDAMKPRWNLFSVEYSLGSSRERLRAEFEDLLGAAERALRLEKQYLPEETLKKRFSYGNYKDFYRERLSLVSLALALKVDESTFDRVVAAVEWAWDDRLVCRLIATRRQEHPASETLGFPKVTALLDRAMDAALAGDRAKAEQLMRQHLQKWYSLWKGVWGWGGHEHTKKFAYWGYWAFETVGIVSALELDDASFGDSEYYPGALLEHPGRRLS